MDDSGRNQTIAGNSMHLFVEEEIAFCIAVNKWDLWLI